MTDDLIPSVVIACRVYDRRHYRTRYYIHVRDGQIVMGIKRRALRMTPDRAGTILAQLRALSPGVAYVAFADSARPPRSWAWPAPKPGRLQAVIDEFAR